MFPDLSVRTEGTYRLKLTLFEVVGANVHHCKSIFSAQFYVYTAKKFPGMEGTRYLCLIMIEFTDVHPSTICRVDPAVLLSCRPGHQNSYSQGYSSTKATDANPR